MTEAACQPAVAPRPRWYHLRPGHLVLALLAVEGLLWVSQRFQWFPFNRHKGWTVLIAVAAVGVFFTVMLVWWLLALVFRLRFQFSLRSLLLLPVVVAIAFGWLGTEMKGAKRQQAAVERLRALNCTIEFLPPADATEVDYTSTETAPEAPFHLNRLLGDCFFHDAGRADCERRNLPGAPADDLRELTELRELSIGSWFSCPEDAEYGVTDAGLTCLKFMPRLHGLSITGGPKLTDRGLESLGYLAELRRLVISNAVGITDMGFDRIGQLPGLREVFITNSSITAATLQRTERFQNLRWLSLVDCRVSDEGLERLKRLKSLRVLILDGVRVGDAGLRHIGEMTELRALSLHGSAVGDAGVAHLGHLSKLRVLLLGWTRVTDAGLEHLRGLTQLEQLDLSSTLVSDAGLERLKCLTKLRALDLSESKVSKAGEITFRALPQFRNLDMSCISALLQEIIVRDGEWDYSDPFDE